jgi:FixJ family two-component response regulator
MSLPHPFEQSDADNRIGARARIHPGSSGGAEDGPSYVFVVHEDGVLRARLSRLFDASGYRTAVFETAAAYMGQARPEAPACLVLGVHLPDSPGVEVQRRIADTTHPPIVFVTAQGDVESSVTAMKEGAVDYLIEPLDGQRLLDAAAVAIAVDRKRRSHRADRARLEGRYARLSPRERQVLPLVVGGLLNKQAGAELGISEITLKSHRGKLMQKMEADSLADLVRMASQLDVPLPAVGRRASASTSIALG